MTEGEVKQATCQVIGTSESGTGWLISVDQILSAYHCLGEAVILGMEVEVSFGAGPSAVKHKAKLEVFDANLDVCVLRLPASPDAAPLPLAVSAPRPGTRWNAFGYPVAKLQIGQVLDGTVQQALSELANGIDLDLSVSAETTLSDYRGMSGAALMTADGCQGLLRVSVDNSLGAVSMAALRGFLSDNNLIPNEGASEDDTFPFAERPTFDETFESSLTKAGGGYLFLDGSHGIGKSTYCKSFRPDSNDIEVLGVYAFSERSRGSTAALQAQPEVFVDWLTSLLSVLATGRPARLSQATYAQLVQTTHQTLQSLAQHCANDGKVGVLFIDGVNEAATIGGDALQRFIGLLPTTIPQGLRVVIVGAGLDAIAGKLAPIFQPVQRLTLPVLDDSIQYSLCTSTLDQDKVSPALVAALCERAKGHPLYLRYLVDIVNGGAGEEDLESLPPFSGAIEDYYETIWAQLLTDADAVNLLGIIARLRWGIPTSDLLVMLTPPESAAFVPTITRIRHLLTAPDTTEVYHSSFSDFVVHKTSAQSVWVQGRLADYCQLPDSGNYGELNRVFHGLLADKTRQLAAINDCQQQWVDQSVLLGAEPDVLLGDIEDSLEAATRLATATEIVRLLLLSQRLKFRYDTLFAQSASLAAEALIALGKTDQALRHILRHGHLIVEHSSAFSIVRLLIEAGHPQEAIEVLQKVDSFLQPTLTRNGVTIGEFLNAAAIRLQGWVLADQAGAEPPTADFLEYVVGLVTTPRNKISPQNGQRILGNLIGNMLGTSLCVVHSYKPLAQIPMPPGVPNKSQVLSLLSILGHAYNHAQSYKIRLPRDKVGMLLEDISSKLDASLDAEDKQFDFVDLLIEAGASPSLVETYASGLEWEWEASALSLFTQHRSLADSAAFFEAYGRLRAAYFLRRDEYQPAPEALLAYDWEDSLETLAASVAWVDAKARHASASSDDEALADAHTYLKEDLLPCLQLDLASRISWQGAYFIPENIVPLLYGYLANLCLDCIPEALTDLLAILEDSFDGQLGLYNEGFRHVMQAVVPRLINTEVSEDVADRVFDLLIRWRNYVRDNVENRHELVPELLSIVPLLARMESEEEALQTYKTVLAVSMGPSWYKEDQFAVMSKTLEVLPATAEIAPAALAQIAAYLEHASGEMTFQRYVRSEKATFIGELSRRGMYSDAVRYFQHQACGSIDEMCAQASHGGLDRVAPLVGMRFPGGALDEQASLVSLLEHIGTAANWRVRWALLEVYQHGDERYLRDWGRAYAKLIQEIAPSSVDLEWAVKRISSIAQAMNDERAWMLLSCLNEALPDTTRDSFSALFERYRDAFEPDDLETLSRRSGIPMGPSPAKAQAAAETKTEATASPTEEESLEDRVVMRGTFGTRVSVRAAEQSMEEARKHLKRRNTSAAVEHAMSALRAVQDGGWSIWSKGHPARMADLLIQDNVRSADELARLYGPLALREQHAQSWSVAYQLMELFGPNLDATQRTQLLSVVTDHVREMVGAAPSDAFAYIGAKTSTTASDALLELLLWALDHPSWERRDSAAAMVLWLLRSDDTWMEKVAPLAFSMESGNRADIAAAVLDILSRENAATLWERVLRFIDISEVTQGCAHASRYVTLLRIANRASSKGIASATDVVKTLRAKALRSESPIALPEDTLHAAHVHSSLAAAWRELQSFGVLDEAARMRVVSVLRELCGQHSFDEVQQLESLAAARFQANANIIPDRWAARLRFALNIALFGPSSIEQLVKIEAVLRIHNPESLIEPPDGRQLIASLIEAITSGDFTRFLPSAADLVFLDVQGYLEHRRQIVRVDLTSHLLSPGQRDPYPVELGTFRPTELPRTVPRDQVAVCSRVKSGLAHFGCLTPSIANPQFHELLRAPTSATVRYHWRDGSTVRTPGSSRPHEVSMLAIQREALRLPPGWRVRWILRVNGIIRATMNKAH